MGKTKSKKKAKAAPQHVFAGTDPVIAPLAQVKPNPWNPNEMTRFEEDALAHGLKVDGWLKSHALLVWGRDEKNKTQNLIIDGEHRWKAAKKIGVDEGPMVFLHGITERQARELTIKLTMKRGSPNDDKLAEVLKSVTDDAGADIALDFGISEDKILALISEPTGIVPEPDSAINTGLPSGQADHTRTVQLVFSHEQYKEFGKLARRFAAKKGTKNHADTVLASLRAATEEKVAKNGKAKQVEARA